MAATVNRTEETPFREVTSQCGNRLSTDVSEMLSDLDSVSAKREVKGERVAGLRGGGAPSLVVLGGWGAVEGPARQVRGH